MASQAEATRLRYQLEQHAMQQRIQEEEEEERRRRIEVERDIQMYRQS